MSPEKENTFRALRDEPLLMTSFWCIFGIHKWTRYTDSERVGLTYKNGAYHAVMRQEKRCVHCNIPAHRVHYLFENTG